MKRIFMVDPSIAPNRSGRAAHSPAKTDAFSAQARRSRYANEIYDDLVVAYLASQCLDRKPVVQPDDQNVRGGDHFCDIAAQGPADRGHVLLDEPAIRSEKVGQMNFGIIDEQ